MRALKMLGGTACAAGLIFAGSMAPASAAGGCPTGGDWNLATTFSVLESVDNGNYADQNGDGFICYKINKGQTKVNDYSSWTWKDNSNPA